ncbi:hypothetical protein ACR3K2_29810 [Cryptosporidium serpentis]
MNKTENIEEVIRFYERIIQGQKKTNQSLLQENIRLRAKLRNEYTKPLEENSEVGILTTPQLSQRHRARFQPKLSPIPQSPLSETSIKNNKNLITKNVEIQTEDISHISLLKLMIPSSPRHQFINEKKVETTICRKYPLRENARQITYSVPSLRVKLRRDTDKPDFDPFKTHEYFKVKKDP